jgi:GxxExxY protein
MTHNQLSERVIGVAIAIHRKLGPGLLEHVYQKVLAHELRKLGHVVEEQVPIPVIWDGERLEVGFRADLILDGMLMLELKSIESIIAVHKKILLTYLRLSDKKLGLILNFGAEVLRDGICRSVNGLEE